MAETGSYRAAFALVVAAPLFAVAQASPWMPLAHGLEASAGWLFVTLLFFPRMTASLHAYLYPLADPAARRLVDWALVTVYWAAFVPAALVRRLRGRKSHGASQTYWRE